MHSLPSHSTPARHRGQLTLMPSNTSAQSHVITVESYRRSQTVQCQLENRDLSNPPQRRLPLVQPF